jgi:hypothetical protein
MSNRFGIQPQFGRRLRFPRTRYRARGRARVLSPTAKYTLFGLAAVAVGVLLVIFT